MQAIVNAYRAIVVLLINELLKHSRNLTGYILKYVLGTLRTATLGFGSRFCQFPMPRLAQMVPVNSDSRQFFAHAQKGGRGYAIKILGFQRFSLQIRDIEKNVSYNNTQTKIFM